VQSALDVSHKGKDDICLPASVYFVQLGIGASMFGVKVNNINIINRKTAWFLHSALSDSDCCKVSIISELLCVKYH